MLPGQKFPEQISLLSSLNDGPPGGHKMADGVWKEAPPAYWNFRIIGFFGSIIASLRTSNGAVSRF